MLLANISDSKFIMVLTGIREAEFFVVADPLIINVRSKREDLRAHVFGHSSNILVQIIVDA